MRRRTYLATTAATATTLAVAGCMGGDDADDAEENGEDDDPGETHPDAAGVFDDFEDLEAWETLLGSMSGDDAHTTGSQAALLTGSTEDEQVRIRRQLDEPADFSAVLPAMTLATENQWAVPYLQLHDADGDRMDFRGRVNGGVGPTACNFGLTNVEGEPDLSEVTEIQVLYWLGEETEGELWVDDLHFTPRPETGKVMIQLVGGYETHYTTALSILESHDLPAAAFVPTGRIRSFDDAEGNRLTEDQLAELDDAGWTIASNGAHGLDLTTLEDRDPADEIADAQAWLEDNGYEDGSRYFAFPGNNYDAASMDLVADHHDLAFTSGFSNVGYATNPHNVPRLDSPSEPLARDALDWTAELGSITTIAFYTLQEEGPAALEATAEHLADLEAAGDVEVVLPGDLTEHVYEG